MNDCQDPDQYDPKDDPEAVKPDLLDFLFTLALMVGLAPELLGGDASGVLSWNWGLHWPGWSTAFDFGVFVLGVLTLAFSWYGFNYSVHRRPVLYRSISGMCRFTLDAVLIVLYGFMLLTFERFGVVFLTLVIVFILYSVWDALKIIEYRDDPWVDDNVSLLEGLPQFVGSVWERESLKYFLTLAVFFGGYLVVHWYVPIHWPEAVARLDWLFLVGLIVVTTHYRIMKMYWQKRGTQAVVERIEDAYD